MSSETPPKPSPAETPQPDDPSRPIHSLVLDTGPLIKNDPSIDTLRSRATILYTTPAVLDEIRDATTRARVDTALVPFLKLRAPRPESMAFVREFARKTGDLEVLSRTDLQLVALAYEVDGERNGEGAATYGSSAGRVQKQRVDKGTSTTTTPANDEDADEKGARQGEESQAAADAGGSSQDGDEWTVVPSKKGKQKKAHKTDAGESIQDGDEWTVVPSSSQKGQQNKVHKTERAAPLPIKKQLEKVKAGDDASCVPAAVDGGTAEEGDLEPLDVELVRVEDQLEQPAPLDVVESDSDDDDWITPANLAEHQARDGAVGSASSEVPVPTEPVDTALLTSDFAMQNVALRMGIPIISPALARITELKTWVLRCHGCFALCRDMSKQFCPRCGQANLMRASCSVGEDGRFRVHLKRNMQWNNRGNVYSVPKPTHGSASGKPRQDAARGGGKNGWGRSLILAADQKEYVREEDRRRKEKARDLMDEDYLPGIVTGDRGGGQSGRIKIGAGRRVNAKSQR